MLKLKDNIKESVSIFFERGRKVTFDINTPPEEYQYYQDLGFRIFECSECLKEFCKCPDEFLVDSAPESPNNTEWLDGWVSLFTDDQSTIPQDQSLTQDNPVQEPQESQDTSEDNVHSNGLDKIIEKLNQGVSQDSPIDSTFTNGPNQTDQGLGYTLEELYAMKLNELRELFPDVKAKTKKKFIEILHNEQ